MSKLKNKFEEHLERATNYWGEEHPIMANIIIGVIILILILIILLYITLVGFTVFYLWDFFFGSHSIETVLKAFLLILVLLILK